MANSVKAQSAPAQQGKLTKSGHEEQVVLPDMFISFMAQQPRLHPRYQEVKRESESWIAKYSYLSVRYEIEYQANISDLVYADTMR